MTPSYTKVLNTLGEIEAALHKVNIVRARAIQAYQDLNDLRGKAIAILAKPQPGDKELGLLDGIDLASMEWAATVERERKAR